MKITRIEIKDFRGLTALVVEPGAGGAVVKGANGKGKTSVLKAVHAALNAEGVGPDAVRLGADKAEILVDLDTLRVRRAITRKGSTVSLASEDGALYPKPQTRLNELLGTTLDPLAFYLAKPPERRRMILEVVPLRVTRQQIEGWIGCPYNLPGMETMHGLEALAMVRADFYQKRTAANAVARDAKRRAGEAVVRPVPEALDPAAAEAALSDADRALERLQIKRATADVAKRATATKRARAKELRDRAGVMLADAPAPPTKEVSEAAAQRLLRAMHRINELREQLAQAETEHKAAHEAIGVLAARQQKADEALEAATKLTSEADTIDATLADMVGEDVSDEAIGAAASVLRDAKAARLRAHEAQELREANARAEAQQREAVAAQRRADELDAIVKTLTEVAPAELAKSTDMIPGLGFMGDAITMDGKPIDDLCGAEQLKLAVEIAKRANARARILVVDGLERLDSAGMNEFVRLATRDGWQLIATRVTDGDLVVEAIEPEEA